MFRHLYASKAEVRSDVTNTRTTVSDIDRTRLKSRKGADGQSEAVSITRTLSPSKYLPLLSLMLGQRSRLQSSLPTDIAYSAPGESLSPRLGNTHGTTSDIRRDVVSEIHHDLVNTKTMVSDLHHNMLKNQEGASDQPQLVSFTRTLPLTKRALTVS
jgi:hypothetical protein